jgi:DNA-binding transcriptional LysR family regulator
MDKLRALQYFSRAAKYGSFGSTARELNVSPAAVSQLIAELECSLGTLLFNRSTRGVALTAAGERYLAVVSQVEACLAEAELSIGSKGMQPRGTLTVGMRSGLGQVCVMPQIGRFFARYPEIELVVKPMESLDAFDKSNVDVAVMTGWLPTRDFVVRRLAQARNTVCASPAYWSRNGIPKQPEDLVKHECLVFRSSGGALLDQWVFERDGERRSVKVQGHLLSDGIAWVDSAACAGVGVIRKSDYTLAGYIESGLLVPALTEWVGTDAPEHFIAYRHAQRRSTTVRAFVDFAVEIFEDIGRKLTQSTPLSIKSVDAPSWYGHVRGRLSDSKVLTRRARP